MADEKKRLATNVEGEFFVDSTCINCDTCRQLAPESFAERGEYSAVFSQPQTESQCRSAMRALLACPTGSIGSTSGRPPGDVMADFPLCIEDDVFYCGFNSRKSYGSNSYFIRHTEGNWMIDSPRYVEQLAESLEALGGLKYIFLTHRDDVADCDRWANRFGAQRIIHHDELQAVPGAEVVLQTDDVLEFSPGFKIIATPGHTSGHCVLLYKEKFLFTGDHLYFDRDTNRLGAFDDYCWYSWEAQTGSMERLSKFDFEWVLPGHGQSVHQPKAQMRQQMIELVSFMNR